MTETQRKIREYQQMLPGLKERVMAVAVLLVVSMTMVVSASFAWITLSQAPEVSMIATTVASNGNLEIALAEPGGAVPEEVAIGDSAAATGMNLVSANITWGNLVNLSDSSYGLNQIDLRPALLSGYGLDTTPLYGATYSADGRVKDVSATYQYATWKQAEDGTWYFAAGKDSTYGVRAISSVKFENITGNAAISNLLTKARNAYATTNSMYMDVINGVTLVDETRNISAMKALTMLLEIFVNEKGESATVSGGDVYYDYKSVVTYTYRLLLEYQKILDAEGEALVLLANLQAYAKNPELGTAHFKDAAELRAASTATLNSLGIKLESLASYKTNYTDLQYGINGLAQYAIDYDPDTGTKTDKVYWADRVPQLDANGKEMKDESGNKIFTTVDGIGKYVSKLVDINSTTANGYSMNQISITNALSVLRNPIKVVIKKGILKDTEQRLGDMLKAQNTTVTINITVMSLGKRDGVVSTDAASPFLSNKDLGYSASLEMSGEGGDAVSLDTYGMAVDLWLRTNSEDAILILEGNVEETAQDATCRDKDGNETALYIAKNEEGSVEVYMLPETEPETDRSVMAVYDRVSHTRIGYQSDMMTEDGGGYTFERKQIMVVTGYSGENRVWEDWKQMLENGLIDENSTTQGAGSCYVFYANPSDQTRILEMLKAFTIAFIDQDGNHVATAKLDIEHHYAINGKVTVPMMITSGVSYIDAEGEERTGIRNMPRNTPTWLTAIIYLDGMHLTNEHVLEAGKIEGRLNIQFGTADRKSAMGNLELQQKYRTVSATAESGGNISTKADEVITYEYDGNAKSVAVTLTVNGDQPNNVNAFFIRSVGSSQGTRTDSVDFKRQSDGTWKATFELTKPGKYTLRTVILDGVEYVLDETPAVEITGLSVTTVRCDPDGGVIMTADQFVDVAVEAVINADPTLMPRQVRALFRSENGKEFSAIMSYDAVAGSWNGLARINVSGSYTLEYLDIDGDYTWLVKSDDPLKNQQKTLNITLGLKAAVSFTGIIDKDGKPISDTNFKFENGPYTIGVGVEILNDGGNPIPRQESVVLHYWLDGGQTDQDGMYTTLTWDGSRYRGHLAMVNAGTYRFDRVAVTNDGKVNNIRSAPGAPAFESAPPEPPRMDMNLTRNGTAEYQFVPGTAAVMSFNMYYAQAADVYAVIENLYDGQQVVVKSNNKELLPNPTNAADLNYYRFFFEVPRTERGNTYHGEVYQEVQDGEWIIKEIWLQKVWDEDGNGYGASVDETTGLPTVDKCLVFDVYDETKTPQENVYTYVVQSIRPVLTGTYTDDAGNKAGDITDKTATVSFGKNAAGTTVGEFMDSYTTSQQTWVLADWNDKPVNGMTVSWEMNFDGDSKNNGGYTGATPVKNSGTVAAGADGITYTIPSFTYQEAGNYVLTLTYSVGSYSGTNKCTYSVFSITPVLSIEKISPEGSHKTISASKTNTTATSRIDRNTNTIYCYPNAEVTGSGCSQSGKLNEEPKVWLKLTGLGNATQATLNFAVSGGGEVRLYYGTNSKEGTRTSAWTWDASTGESVMRFVGYNDAGSCDDSKPAGTLTSEDRVVLTYNGKSYYVAVSVITIENNRP